MKFHINFISGLKGRMDAMKGCASSIVKRSKTFSPTAPINKSEYSCRVSYHFNLSKSLHNVVDTKMSSLARNSKKDTVVDNRFWQFRGRFTLFIPMNLIILKENIGTLL